MTGIATKRKPMTPPTAAQADSAQAPPPPLPQPPGKHEAVPPPAMQPAGETGGPKGPEPTRYGDWEKGGRCFDF